MNDKTVKNSKVDKKQETMIHPFNGTECIIKHLEHGDIIEPSDIYQSATIGVKGNAITPETGGIGKWMLAGDVVSGAAVAKECNVHFIRLLPTVDSELKQV